MKLGRTVGDCRPVPFGEDVWTQTALHGPGNSKWSGTVINRAIVYRLRPPGGEPFLAVLNALWMDGRDDGPIAGLRALEAETGAKVRFILTPDSAHHLSLAPYAGAFGDARVCVPAGRIERENPALMALPNVEAYAAGASPRELTEAGLDIMVWRGLREGPVALKFQRMSMRFGYQLGDVQPQIFLHRPSGTITNGGHNFWYRHDEDEVFDMPGPVVWMFERMMGLSMDYQRPGRLNPDPNGAVVVADRAAAQASAAEVLDWDFDAMIDIHSKPGGHLQAGARGVFEEALGPIARGQWDQVAWPTA